ncbi:MAG: flagellar filament outer layer protein FlaA [Spirochaetaceae bacterium]|jgi:hypothetical protein|nr:flagellar filament outer layer protein FlaA [Spirochaetaceae bacterium]
MKRSFMLIAMALLVAGAVIAEEAVLIDFTKIAADIYVDPGNPEGAQDSGDQAPNQNRQTMMDFSGVAGNSYTQAQKQVMRTSLGLENWEVHLASSSRTVINQGLSFTKPAASTQYGTVMGVRVHFPVEPFNSWARIAPPFEIPAYDWDEVGDDGSVTRPARPDRRTPSRFEDGFGVVKNVGTVKAVAVNVYGLNFPHALSVILIDNDGTERIMQMGYLQFDGWAELRWDNPAYLQEVRNRDLRLYPLYPQSTPFIKFGGFLIQRDGGKIGGDFVSYFREVRLIYDKAVLETERDINDEDEWQIIQTREDARKAFEVRRFGHSQVLRYLERQKQATETEFNFQSGQQQE